MGKIFGGSKPKGPTAAQLQAEQAQASELTKLKGQEDQRTAAAARKKRGRASLISGAETGLSDTLG